jgi:hypothetical protein
MGPMHHSVGCANYMYGRKDSGLHFVGERVTNDPREIR